jgi:hypothetical protein
VWPRGDTRRFSRGLAGAGEQASWRVARPRCFRDVALSRC